jgi:site-specific DNA-cytosine methylase
MMNVREIRHFHLFAGLGGGAKGFNAANPRVGNMVGRFRCLGGVDVDPAAIRDFGRLAGVPGTVMDLFDREQYCDFHGHEPPPEWREATPADIRTAAGGEYPHIVFLSAPCKGFSGLLSQQKSGTVKYLALNRLTLRGIWLMLEAFGDDPPALVVFENVPRIKSRGRHLLDQIVALLRSYGYAVAETTHDCGELGGLAQSRKRFLLVARHVEKVPAFLYEPEKKNLQAVGTVLGRMPLPGDPAGGAMHRLPSLAWKTWVRLAFVEAGSDWRSLNKLAVEDGILRDYLIVPEYRGGYLGVLRWDETCGTVAGETLPSNGKFSVADPRTIQNMHHGIYGIRPWDAPCGTVQGHSMPGNGQFSVADPRYFGHHEYQQYGVRRWDETCGTVSGQSAPGGGAYSVADPRQTGSIFGKYAVTGWDQSSGTVIAGSTTGQGAFSVADPRPPDRLTFSKYTITPWESHACTVIGGHDPGGYAVADPRPNLCRRAPEDDFYGGGHYGVIPWDQFCGAISSAANCDNGRWSVADPRLPDANEKLVCIIRALDGTWHRPFTTLELAALQSLVDPEEVLELDGLSDQAWRERIGNAVPPDAARAIAEVMGTTLLLAESGETFTLSSVPIWVRPVAVALAVAQGGI